MRLAEVHAALSARDGTLNRAIVEHRDFGRPDHVLWTRAPGFDRARALGVDGSYELIPGALHAIALRANGRPWPLPRARTWARRVEAQLATF